MRHARQVELLRRLQGDAVPRPGPLGAASMRNRADVYTSPARFTAEMRVLFGQMPLLVGLSCEVRTPGSYLTATLGTVPVAVVRQSDGGLRGFVNICRHRGSTLLVNQMGDGLQSIRCPYHAWTYGLDGTLRAFPGAEAGFDDVDKSELGLIEISVAEEYGLIFASAAGEFTVDDALHGAQDELADYGLEHYEHVETRTHEWDFNWKLVMDTFTEPYHIPWIHKDTIAPYYMFDRWIYDAYGPHQRFIGTRKSVIDEFEKASDDEWDLLPHGTIQYLLIPNAVLTHQIDHFELWRLTPVTPVHTIITTSVYAPEPPATEKARAYFVKNLDVLLGVTNTEDFPAQARVQRNLSSGALPEVVYGKMEPALVGYHTAINKLLADAGEMLA
jgi:phenylpropionate dioxygenase-like ring-hydroxylating dioxygenase large terminal subunit